MKLISYRASVFDNIEKFRNYKFMDTGQIAILFPIQFGIIK